MAVLPGVAAEDAQGLHHLRLLALHQGDLAVGGVVPVAHTGGQGLLACLQGAQHTARHFHRADHGLQHVPGDPTWPQDAGLAVAHIHHGGFQAHVAAAPVDDQRDAAVHVLQHMPGGGGAGLAGAVGAGGGNGQMAGLEQRGRHGVGGHAHRHGVQPGGDRVGDGRTAGHDQRQWAGPEGVHQRERRLRHMAQAVQLAPVPDVHDQRIVRRTALGSKNARHCLGIEGVGAKAVDRLRGEGHQLPLRQQAGGQGQGGFVSREHLRVHGKTFFRQWVRAPGP